ncbi:hypothetical protein A2U01_0058111 [Trifolium medium]|uniref:Uncharacterized protein n=1 Tax=Trifolium medium TaxID=97028 RepID=A0A392RKU1_9FABA|nr:hypothetical protein [Trifolium medium]
MVLQEECWIWCWFCRRSVGSSFCSGDFVELALLAADSGCSCWSHSFAKAVTISFVPVGFTMVLWDDSCFLGGFVWIRSQGVEGVSILRHRIQ